MSRDRRWGVVIGVIAIVAAGCGGGGAASTTEDMVVTSGDGMAELFVPAGAVASDVEITVESTDPSDSFVVDGVMAFAYDLQPSGLVFDTPATLAVTFDFEAEPGVPVAFVVIEDGSGLEAVPARVTRTGDEVLIEAEVSHFSKAQIVVQTAVIPVEVGCGDTLALGDLCDIVLRDLDQFSGVTSTSFESASAAIAVSASSFDRATFECISEQPLGRAVTVTVIADTSLYSFLQQAGGITGLDASDFIGDYVHRVECVVADSIVPELSVYVVDIGSNRYSVSVPDRAAAGSGVEAEVCGTDTSSSPLTGTGFLSLSPNENAGDPNALHGNSPFGPDGCTMITLHLPDDAITGLWTVFTADEASNTAAEVTQLEVTPGE